MDNNIETIEEFEVESPELQILSAHKTSAYNWRERRHDDWTENYTLYRDKVIVNRLTQRQSVNIPLMKTAIKTALKDVDDAPALFFENLDSNKDKEIYFNEYFKYVADYNKLEIKDIVDKKQVFLYGRSFKKINIVNGKFVFEILDPQDVLVDRYVDPVMLDTARYVSHIHIFKPLSSLLENESYNKEAVRRLQTYMATKAGLLKATDNSQALTDKNKRMSQMGVPDIYNPVLGETYIEINEHYLKKWNKEEKEDEFWIYVTAENREVLLAKRLEDVIGETADNYWRYHLPILTWADDVERTDFWSDGMADTLRTPNRILNSWISQLVENRTLRNFGMNFYDSTIEGFNPQSWEPKPFGWYGLPGKPTDVLQRVDIPDLSESIDEMTFVLNIAEKAAATTSVQQGATEDKKITLGEVEIMMANATERIKAMSIFYTNSWEEFGTKYIKMLEATEDMLEGVTLYKKGLFNDEIFSRDVKPKSWKSKSGYRVKVMSQAQKEEDQMQGLQKMNAIVQSIPGNTPLIEIYQKKLLEFGNLTPDEMQQVLDFEKQKSQQPMLGDPNQMGQADPTAVPQGAPVQPNLMPMA